MRPGLTPPPRLSPGDRVAVLSLSFAAPALFPAVHEQAMRRLRDPSALASFPAQRPGTGWAWHQPTRVVTAPTWGGNLEILHSNLAASRWIRPAEDYAGCILLLETSEERPAAEEVFRMLRNFGERGLLGVLSGNVGQPGDGC
jgi:muramoyltetrapeptide carboxypeptidase LdcA involved in peptidoglycan recycling